MSNKTNKKENGVIEFFSTNKKTIVALVIGACLGALVMTFFFPERIAKLENGEEVILRVKNHSFTANDLYNAMKEENGNEALFKMVDIALLKDKYPNREEDAKKFAEEQKEAVFTSYQQYYGYTKEEFLQANGFASEEEFEADLISQFYYQQYYDEYTRENITKKEISKFYKESVFGEKSIYLFSALDENKAELSEVQNMLKDKKSFDDIKSKYETVNSYKYDSVKYTDSDMFTQTILNKIASTKKGSSSGIFTDDSYGNVIVYVVSEKEKAKEADIQEEMKDAIVKSKQTNDDKLYYQAFIHLREENDLSILDTELKEFYEKSIKQFK